MKKRIFCIALTAFLMMSLFVFPVSAENASGTCGENATWTFDSDTGTLTISGTGVAVGEPGDSSDSYAKYREKIVNVVVEEGITEIAEPGFPRLYNMQTLTLPDSLVTLGRATFMWCDDLKEIRFGMNLRFLGEAAFDSSFSLEKVVIPPSVEGADMSVFADCWELKQISVPAGLEQIPPGFLRNTAISEIFISKGVTTIGQAAFHYCDNLTDVYYEGTQAQWEAIQVVKYNDQLLNATVHFEHSHSFDGGTVNRQATCAKKGIKIYTCTVCNFAKQETFSGEHKWDGGKVTKASCTEDGKTLYTCTACKKTKETPITAPGHSWDTGTKNSDTTVTYKCKTCGLNKIEGTPVVPTEPKPAIPTAPTETTAPTLPETLPETTPETVPTASTGEATTQPTEPTPEQRPGENGGAPWIVAVIVVVLAAGGVAAAVIWRKKKTRK